MPTKTNHRPAVQMALAASAGLTVLIIFGSRNLEHYDAALFGYTVASVVAFGAVVFRYAIWLQRPATRVYWRRGWKLFRDRRPSSKDSPCFSGQRALGGFHYYSYLEFGDTYASTFRFSMTRCTGAWCFLSACTRFALFNYRRQSALSRYCSFHVTSYS